MEMKSRHAKGDVLARAADLQTIFLIIAWQNDNSMTKIGPQVHGVIIRSDYTIV